MSVYHAVNNWFTGFMCQCNYHAVNTSKSCLHSFVETQRVYLLAEFGLGIVLQLYIQSISLQEFAIYMAYDISTVGCINIYRGYLQRLSSSVIYL